MAITKEVFHNNGMAIT